MARTSIDLIKAMHGRKLAMHGHDEVCTGSGPRTTNEEMAWPSSLLLGWVRWQGQPEEAVAAAQGCWVWKLEFFRCGTLKGLLGGTRCER